jgi:hypothetical protein
VAARCGSASLANIGTRTRPGTRCTTCSQRATSTPRR